MTKPSSQPKVYDFQTKIGIGTEKKLFVYFFGINTPGEYDVVGFYVQMDNVLAMEKFKTLQKKHLTIYKDYSEVARKLFMLVICKNKTGLVFERKSETFLQLEQTNKEHKNKEQRT